MRKAINALKRLVDGMLQMLVDFATIKPETLNRLWGEKKNVEKPENSTPVKIGNELESFCVGCPYIRAETLTLFANDEPVEIVVSCMRIRSCRRIYEMEHAVTAE